MQLPQNMPAAPAVMYAIRMNCRSLGADGQQLFGGRCGQLYDDKATGGIEIVLSRFVDDAQEVVFCCFFIGQDAVEFPDLQVITPVCRNANRESRWFFARSHS